MATPADVVELYEAIVTDSDFGAHAALSSEVASGDQEGTLSGFIDFLGDDFHSQVVMAHDGGERIEEVIAIQGEVFNRKDDGPWVRSDEDDPGWSLGPILAETTFENAGTTTRDGRRLHRLVPSQELPPEAIGGPPTGEASLEVLVDDDGQPVLVMLEVASTDETPSGPVVTSSVTEFRLDVGGQRAVHRPNDPWVKHVSTLLPYTAAIHNTWIVEESGTEGGSGEAFLFWFGEIQVHLVPLGATTADEWFAGTRAAIEENLGPVEAEEAITVGGMETSLLTTHYLDDGGEEITYMHVSFVRGPVAYGVVLYADSGLEGRASKLYRSFLTTFEPTIDVDTTASPPMGNVWNLQPGDCFNASPIAFGLQAGARVAFVGGVDDFASVACDGPHQGEVIEVATGPEPPCEQAFEAYVGQPLAGSEFALLHFVPLSADNAPPEIDHLCVVASPLGSSTGSARASP